MEGRRGRKNQLLLFSLTKCQIKIKDIKYMQEQKVWKCVNLRHSGRMEGKRDEGR